MNLTISRRAFADLVGVVAPAAMSKTNAILAGILLVADDFGRLVASATDYDLEIQSWVEADVGEPGAIVIPAAILARALAVLGGDTVTLATRGGDGGGVLAGGGATFEFQGFDAAEFPAIEPPTASSRRVEIPAATLAAGIAGTLPFASENESHAALCNVRLVIDGPAFAFAATDRNRLGAYEGRFGASLGRGAWLLSRGMATAIAAAIGRTDAAPWIDVDGRKLLAVVGPTSIRGRTSDESFPDYRRVIPAADPGASVVVDRARLHDAIRRVMVLAERDREGLMRVALTFGGEDGVTVSATMATVGKARDAFDLFGTRADGRVVQVGVSPAYCIAALAVFKSAEHVTIQAATPTSPLLFSSPAIPGLVHVCMPMRLGPPAAA
jgi:DNA polymerase-3 subunit beta